MNCQNIFLILFFIKKDKNLGKITFSGSLKKLSIMIKISKIEILSNLKSKIIPKLNQNQIIFLKFFRNNI